MKNPKSLCSLIKHILLLRRPGNRLPNVGRKFSSFFQHWYDLGGTFFPLFTYYSLARGPLWVKKKRSKQTNPTEKTIEATRGNGRIRRPVITIFLLYATLLFVYKQTRVASVLFFFGFQFFFVFLLSSSLLSLSLSLVTDDKCSTKNVSPAAIHDFSQDFRNKTSLSCNTPDPRRTNHFLSGPRLYPSIA